MSELIADFRSDTVTRPCVAMKQAMVKAELGDDVLGDDPTVKQLEDTLARLAGKEAGLFLPTGTQSNLVALMAHCERGDEYIVGQEAHTYKYEGGGAAVLGSIQPQPIEFEPDATLDLAKVRAKIKADDSHFARSRLLCLENTCSGKVLPFDYHASARAFCDEHGLGLHLDGARLFNACVKQQVSLEAISRYYDSVSLCLSKGLGTPAGSVLVGSAEVVADARRWRKVLGGGLRQSGMLAAAGLYALDNSVERLAEDHDNARRLAEGLSRIEGISCDPATVETNMVFAVIENPEHADALKAHLEARGVLTLGGQVMRLVTHKDIDAAAVDASLALFASFSA
ncbi:low-specificity L-threonine aldolase [Halioglobus japonicus]|uniref:Low-specificity L-threonine aldolase n=1 Tax=Halioglobus japonicus TaxID=930805 RepID=A0AAP8SPG6_9GAMM|nr:low-specificity L-threonine aldolase [Halioglobus japonicus]AQA19299.1 low-specificity L-threonine aldolase [Halioglobus japonicus]PLW87662.1 low-specificity L-threonine aldolase [Halioglobus japonicus]GHD07243.1 threonine aldolase [Halioglobus japonicus]